MDLQGIRWAASLDDVNRAVVYPGTAALFMYTEEDAFAIKNVDRNGFATVNEYDFFLRVPPPPEGYVRQEDYDRLAKELEDVKSALSAVGSGDQPDGAAAKGEGVQGDATGCDAAGVGLEGKDEN